jgi:hypothetical protein
MINQELFYVVDYKAGQIVSDGYLTQFNAEANNENMIKKLKTLTIKQGCEIPNNWKNQFSEV